ncbi:phosphatidate cytidylyltransferase [Methylotenera sp.]|uniref:phosphatidate cytidylyltransferase n=1 Tax=Methylotenera sp. TaxID=2051956 RepID=UPI002486E70B|nr:phosphatidate cytidylyltransferase [Methylotenera sp.]MDI1299616.1 phosphatidate cytidylyltransferase [Methylotenera sp.]
MLKTRVITAVFLTIGFLMVLFLASKMVWTCFTLAATLVGVWEWAKLIKLNKHYVPIYVASALAMGLLWIFTIDTPLALYHDGIVFSLLSLSALFWIAFSPLWLITRKKINQKILMAFLGLVLLMSTWLALNGLQSISPWLLLGVLAIVWLADIAAYFAGKRFGRHKLAPEISPGKTWEGVAGAILAVTIYGLVLSYYMHYSRWIIVGLWLTVILSVMGDLFESLLKRQAGVKDSSHLLPGHGGVLDRIDGLIPTLPFVLFYIYYPLFSSLQLHAR